MTSVEESKVTINEIFLSELYPCDLFVLVSAVMITVASKTASSCDSKFAGLKTYPEFTRYLVALSHENVDFCNSLLSEKVSMHLPTLKREVTCTIGDILIRLSFVTSRGAQEYRTLYPVDDIAFISGKGTINDVKRMFIIDFLKRAYMVCDIKLDF